MQNIVIFGAGGLGREVQWLIERINEKMKRETGEDYWNICGYIDDTLDVGTMVNDYKVLGGIDYLLSSTEIISIVCAIGSAKARRSVISKLMAKDNFLFPNLIDPSVIMSDRIQLGKGNIICAGTILTVNINIGDYNLINLDCTLGHDVLVSDFTTIYPSANVSGYVHIGKCTEIGTGTQIIQGKKIGENVIIGAGSVVIRDIPSDCTAVGCPCKPI